MGSITFNFTIQLIDLYNVFDRCEIKFHAACLAALLHFLQHGQRVNLSVGRRFALGNFRPLPPGTSSAVRVNPLGTPGSGRRLEPVRREVAHKFVNNFSGRWFSFRPNDFDRIPAVVLPPIASARKTSACSHRNRTYVVAKVGANRGGLPITPGWAG